MSAGHKELTVVRSNPERVEDALSALLAAGPAASARFARQAEASRVSLERIWCLADEFGRYRLAVLAVPTLGRTAMLLASHPRSADEAAMLGKAVDAAAEGCADACDIAQALVDPMHPLDVAAFEAGGLVRLATLDYLERNLPRAGSLEPPTAPAGWSIEPVADASLLGGADPAALGEERRAELIAVLEASYRDTRDCPGLAGMRRTADVLDGHFGLGARPRHWFIARGAGGARGVCLVNGSADSQAAELVYLGLSPEARGKGVAQALLAKALHACSCARVGVVSLAVDSLNEPAKRLYLAHGFRRVSSRVALVRRLRTA